MQASSTLRRRDPLYRKIYAKLRETIAAGSVPVGSLLPSELQLCERHKASRITVKHALDLLREDGLVRVIHGAGWQVIALAPDSAPRTPRAPTLGDCLLVIPPRLEAMIFTRAVEDRLRALGASVYSVTADRRVSGQLLEAVRASLDGPQPPRGIVFFNDVPPSAELLALLRDRGVRAVFAGLQDLVEYSAVAMDNVGATGALTRLLLDRGHRSVLFVGAEKLCTKVPSFRARMEGCRAVLRERGLAAETLLIEPNNLLLPANEQAFGETLRRMDGEGRRPTAFVAPSGATAQGVATALARRGLSVPRDCALVCIGAGYDAEVMEGLGLHGVTCVEEPWEDIALAAADALAEQLQRPAARPRLTIVQGRLIDHGTVPPIR